MSDDLIVSGGGSTAVAIDELFVDASRLAVAEAVTTDWIARAGVIRRGLAALHLEGPAVRFGPTEPTYNLTFAVDCLEHANRHAVSLRGSLLEAAERYGATERFVDGLWQLGAMFGAPWIGFATPSLVVVGLLAALGQAVGSATVRAFGGDRTPLEAWLDEHRGLLSDPAFVRLVRTAADHVDEVVAGMTHHPWAVALARLAGAPENASLLIGAAALVGAVTGSRLLVEGPVQVTRLRPQPDRRPQSMGAPDPDRAALPVEGRVPAPSGLGELADRIPTTDAGAQIRVERYGEAGDTRWVVYVGGTVDFGLSAGAETNDMTSNLHGIADDAALDALRLVGADSGATERAVRLALTEAGAHPGDPIFAVGHSGGGVVAAGLAGDSELNVVGAVSLGGPVATAPLAEGVKLLSIEHEEDFVPGTGGWGHPSPDRLTVSRSVLEEGREYDAVVPAHELLRYRETAALLDASEEARVVAFRERLAVFTGGGEGELSRWVATRDLSPATTTGER